MVSRTTLPEPVTAVIDVPFILNELPMPAVSNVLLVNVLVVAAPTRVSVDVGRVNVADPFNIVPIFGDAKVLLLKVSMPASVAKSPSARAVLNSAMVPVSVLLARSIDLLVRVSVVFLATSVSEDVGSVSVPELTIVDITGEVKVGDVSNTNFPVPVAPVDVTPSMVG